MKQTPKIVKKTVKKVQKVYVGIEMGGTSCKVGFTPADDSFLDLKKISISTKHCRSFVTHEKKPGVTLENIYQHIVKFCKEESFEIEAIGIASFGPVDLDRSSKFYGYITTTPKPNWGNTRVLGYFKDKLKSIPFGFDTDVNPVAITESMTFKKENLAYVTVGTGIGVGLVMNGKPVHGLLHPEAGHIFPPLHKSDKNFKGTKKEFKGVCKFHGGRCLEGLAASGSIAKRCGVNKKKIETEVKEDDPVWDAIAHYLAHLCLNLVLINSVEMIVLGGGLMNHKKLLGKIQVLTKDYLGGYIKKKEVLDNMDKFIVKSKFGTNSGMIGAYMLAKKALEQEKNKKEEDKKKKK